MMSKAVFLDRDGTINVDYGYLHDPAQLEFLPGAVEALKSLQDNGFKLIVITNQSGIGRGYFTVKQYNNFNSALVVALEKSGVKIEETFMCPHAPNDDCTCRKPYPFMVLQAIENHQLDPKQCYMFGDKPSDVACGEAAGVTSRLIEEKKDLLYWANEIIEKRL